MTLQDAFESVLALQAAWAPENSSAMQQRGGLIRNEIPTLLTPLAKAHGLEVQGRDGSGSKTRVPWVRLYNPQLSPKATEAAL
jgi:hypothetical protein